MRRRHPWLYQARIRALDLGNTYFIYEASHEGHRLVVALNLEDSPVTRSIPCVCDVVAGHATCNHTRPLQTQITVSPHGWAILTDTTYRE